MEVTGKIRLKRDLNLTTLTCPDVSRDSFGPTLSSGPQRKDDDNEGEDCKEASEEGRKEGGEEEEVTSFCLGPRETAVISVRNFAVSLVAALLISSAAHAATVTNRDARDHKVTIIEGDAQNYHVVKANAVLEGICQKGCLIRLDDSEEDPYELKGSEVTSIEEGQLYDDELEAPAVPEVGNTGPPSQPSSQP